MQVLVNGEVKNIGHVTCGFDWLEWFMNKYSVAGEDMNFYWNDDEELWECDEETYSYWHNEVKKAIAVYNAENSSMFAELDEREKDEYWEIYKHEDFVEFPNELLLVWLEEKGIVE